VVAILTSDAQGNGKIIMVRIARHTISILVSREKRLQFKIQYRYNAIPLDKH